MKKQLIAILMAAFMLVPGFTLQATAASKTAIVLTDNQVLVDGSAASTDSSSAVYVGEDIVYYKDGTDATYGEGSENDMHTAEEAKSHTVVTITQPGTYTISGTLSAGQIAVDLGEEAADNPDAVVTLILSGVDITCSVGPAIVFYNVYECSATEPEEAANIVDTSAAGANIIVADGTVNTVNGSYVAKIYKEGTTSKLYKFDGTIHALMSMNVSGGPVGDGILNIYAENEGLDSDINLTVNGSNINIYAGNDGINTSEDEVSVFTMNGGRIYVENTGNTGEGDGIDSNGWIVINDGTIIAGACTTSQDSGIDSDLGITINGGNVLAYGSMYDEIESDSQTFVMLSFSQVQSNVSILLCDADGNEVATLTPTSAFSILVYSAPDITEGDYTCYLLDTSGNRSLLSGSSSQSGMMGGSSGGQMPEGTEPPEGMEPPEGFDPNQTDMTKGNEIPAGMELPEDFDPTKMDGGMSGIAASDTSDVFTITEGGNFFYSVSTAAVTNTGLPFSDIAKTDSCYEAVKYIYDNGIMAGTSDTLFEPDAVVTRAMAVTVIGQLMDINKTETTAFTDVETGAWYSEYISWAESNGIIEGYGDGTFGPNDTLSATQLELVLSRYANLAGITYSVDDSAGTGPVTRGELAEKIFALLAK